MGTTTTRKPPVGRRRALACMSAAEEKKSHDCIALDIRKISVVADYFVICTGDSQRQVKAIAEGMIESLKVKGVRCWHSEGWSESSWIVLDFGDVIAHVFLNQVRDYYQLERLWGDAATVTSDK